LEKRLAIRRSGSVRTRAAIAIKSTSTRIEELAIMLKRILVSVGLLFVCTSCTTFTSIHPNEDGSYKLTRVKQGFFRVSSRVYTCQAQGDTLACKTVNKL
jgi:hypothetical protein